MNDQAGRALDGTDDDIECHRHLLDLSLVSVDFQENDEVVHEAQWRARISGFPRIVEANSANKKTVMVIRE